MSAMPYVMLSGLCAGVLLGLAGYKPPRAGIANPGPTGFVRGIPAWRLYVPFAECAIV